MWLASTDVRFEPTFLRRIFVSLKQNNIYSAQYWLNLLCKKNTLYCGMPKSSVQYRDANNQYKHSVNRFLVGTELAITNIPLKSTKHGILCAAVCKSHNCIVKIAFTLYNLSRKKNKCCCFCEVCYKRDLKRRKQHQLISRHMHYLNINLLAVKSVKQIVYLFEVLHHTCRNAQLKSQKGGNHAFYLYNTFSLCKGNKTFLIQ